jgi:hypothetical protein
MRSLLALAAAAAFAAPAADAPAPKVLRQLVYDVTYSARTTHEVKSSGLNSGYGGGTGMSGDTGGVANGSGTASQLMNGDDHGKLTIDVVAATADGGLVVDLTESANGRNRAKVRFAVTGDGTVTYDPKEVMNVSQEEIALARWLARGFYGEHPIERGTEWTVDQSSNGLSASEHYRVTGAADNRVTLEYALEEKSAGAASYGEIRLGSLVYDTALVVPVQATYQGEARRELFGAFDKTTTSVTLTLRSDTFAKKR